MARGRLAAQTPIVSPDSFIAFDLAYRYLQDLDKDLSQLEGVRWKTNQPKISTTALAADPLLQFALKPFQKVRLRFRLFVDPNFKFRLVGTTAASLIMLQQSLLDNTGNTTSFLSAYHGADVVAANATIVNLEGIIHNGAASSVVSISWAQNTSSATPVNLYAGSQLQYSLVD